MLETKQNNNAIRTLKVIYESLLRGPSAVSKEDIFQYPLYKVIRPGVLRLDPGVKRNPSDIFVFVVDGAPKWFMEKYSHLIRDMQVFKTVIKPSTTPIDYPVKITTLMSLCGVYPTLDGAIVDALGHDYVCLTNTDEGIKIESVNLSNGVNEIIGDVYLQIDTDVLSDDLLGIISVDLVELVPKENGLYTAVGTNPIDEKTIN